MGDETRIGRLVIGDGNTIREHVTIIRACIRIRKRLSGATTF
jgi:acyl-[acyl carrier protein]--UDP-N-acetylglucosamine O-acyltransferase